MDNISFKIVTNWFAKNQIIDYKKKLNTFSNWQTPTYNLKFSIISIELSSLLKQHILWPLSIADFVSSDNGRGSAINRALDGSTYPG